MCPQNSVAPTLDPWTPLPHFKNETGERRDYIARYNRALNWYYAAFMGDLVLHANMLGYTIEDWIFGRVPMDAGEIEVFEETRLAEFRCEMGL